MKPKILLIEDDASAGKSLHKVLIEEGYWVDWVQHGETGLQKALNEEYHLILTDLRLPGLTGMEILERIHAVQSRVPIIMMTAHGTTETAIEATKVGAYDYLVKPFEVDDLLDLVATAVDHSLQMLSPIEIGMDSVKGEAIVGNSRAMQSVYKEIGRVAPTSVSVLIRGETGTGKELVARAIYQHSERANKAFVAVNCAAIPDTLLESELFGHERGAFTGAQARRIGRFEQAHRGTIFLDEIGDLHPNTQAKLLRVLQEKTIQRLGGNETIPVDVRVLAATHRNLEEAIESKTFREDLYYRLSGMTISLPPLRERLEDLPVLIHYLMQRHGPDLGQNNPSIQAEALGFLQNYGWPGNIRELENVLRQSMLIARPLAVGLSHVQHAISRDKRPKSLPQLTHSQYVADLLLKARTGELTHVYTKLVNDLEAELFSQAIQLAQGNQAKAARWLGVTRLKMREKLRDLDLHPPSQPGKREE